MKRIWLREARKKAGLTQMELAGRLGKPQSFISRLERGRRGDPAVSAALRLADILQVDVRALQYGPRDTQQA